MKTIEQAAIQLAPTFWHNKTGQVTDLRRMTEAAFIAGAAFAQEWISVDDEKPKQGQDCLFKIDNTLYVGYYDYSTFRDFDNNIVRENIAHWRPINRE